LAWTLFNERPVRLAIFSSDAFPSSFISESFHGCKTGFRHGIAFSLRLAVTALTDRPSLFATALSGIVPMSFSSLDVQTRSLGSTGLLGTIALFSMTDTSTNPVVKIVRENPAYATWLKLNRADELTTPRVCTGSTALKKLMSCWRRPRPTRRGSAVRPGRAVPREAWRFVWSN